MVFTSYRLADAFKAKNGPKKIYAYNVPCQYIVATEKKFWNKFLFPKQPSERCFYEVIEEDKPCHLYVDIDINRQSYPSFELNTIKQMVCSHIEYGLNAMELKVERCFVTDSSNERKGSLHILYHIKDHLWASNAHVGAFMRRCMEMKVKQNEEDYFMWTTFVDMCVYSRNRLFRMLGCTKKHELRTKQSPDIPFDFQHWKACQIQPCLYADHITLIECNEPDGRSACYMGSKAVPIIDFEPTIRAHLMDFASEIAPVRTINYIPAYMQWYINLDKRQCIFKGEEHKKNTNYMVVNWHDNTYHFKCWNRKYDCCIHGKSHVNPLPQELCTIIDKYMNFVISPSIDSSEQ